MPSRSVNASSLLKTSLTCCRSEIVKVPASPSVYISRSSDVATESPRALESCIIPALSALLHGDQTCDRLQQASRMQPGASPIESTLSGMLSLEAKALQLFDGCSRLEDEQPLVCEIVITFRLIEQTRLRLQSVIKRTAESTVDCTVLTTLSPPCIECICTNNSQTGNS